MPHKASTQRAIAWIVNHHKIPKDHPPILLREERKALRQDLQERFISIGATASLAVESAHEAGSANLDFSDLPDDAPIPWTSIAADLYRAGMTEFHPTPYGFVLLDVR